MIPRYYWHIHHEELIEPVWFDYSIESRVIYINTGKHPSERPLRLHLMKPAVIPKELAAEIETHGIETILHDPDYHHILTELTDIHKEQCDPNCPYAPDPEYLHLEDISTIFQYCDLDGNWCLSGRENSRTSDWAQENTYKEPIYTSIE